MDYTDFLKSKSQLAGSFGFDPIFMPSYLFDFQVALVEWACQKGRGAIFSECGSGKTPMALTWAENVIRKTNGKILIGTPLAVGHQMVREASKFGIEAHRSGDGKPRPNITVTNYEKLHLFDPNDYTGMVCDESGCLKNFDGKRRGIITEFMKKMPYRLLCTATPSPNDYIELGTSSEALGHLGYMDMLGKFFKNTQNSCDTRQTGIYYGAGRPKWRFKRHAEQHFWKWVCSWARALRRPSDMGFDDGDFLLPELIEKETVIPCSRPLDGKLFVEPAIGLKEQRQERRATLTERCEKVAELVNNNSIAVAWCHLNDEGDLLENLIPDAMQVSGSMSDEKKEEIFEAFGNGEIRVLVTKPKIGGFGLNWQHCAHMTTFPSHCYDEQTEVLTYEGWKGFDSVTSFDKIATINKNDLSFEWQSPTDIIWNKYSGDMIQFGSSLKTNKSFDLIVTPNHRMFVQKCPDRYNTDGKWEFLYAKHIEETFKKQEYRMLSCPIIYDSKSPEYIKIPKYNMKKRLTLKKVNKSGNYRGLSRASLSNFDIKTYNHIESIKINDFVKLAGWYLSEGYCSKIRGKYNGQLVITQTDSYPDNRKEIIDLLNRIGGLNVYSKTKNIRTCSMNLSRYIGETFGCGSYNKFIPQWVKNLNKKHLKILVMTMLKGDGGSHKKGEQEYYYRTTSKRLADDFQEICLKIGIRASVHKRRNGGNGKYKDLEFYDVNIARKNIRPYIHIKPSIIEYNGMIGCVTVPNGTIIVRRNGIPVVSGNSYEQYYQSVRRFWRFGQTKPVVVDVVSTEGELAVLKNLQRKAEQADKMFDNLVGFMNEALTINKIYEADERMEIPSWL